MFALFLRLVSFSEDVQKRGGVFYTKNKEIRRGAFDPPFQFSSDETGEEELGILSVVNHNDTF